MAQDRPTQPKGIDPTAGEPHEPMEIPVPKRSVFDKLLRRPPKPAKKGTDPGDGRNWIDIAG
jgi:hypothetical protein